MADDREGPAPGEAAQLLALDPELGEGLDREELAAASASLPVRVNRVGAGEWLPPAEQPHPLHLGYLVVEGLLVRRVVMGGGSSVELLGRGSLLRPWQEEATSFSSTSWEVLEPSRLVSLGPAAAAALGRWPAILTNLAARLVARSRAMAAGAATASIVGVEQRLLLMLWLIAETWGRVDREGVHLTVRLPHRLLAELIAARRPSVTTALTALQDKGRLATASDGCWVLLGEPPISSSGRLRLEDHPPGPRRAQR